MSGKKSRDKGARGERKLAEAIRAHGYEASRNARNGISSEDISHTVPGVHIECKHQEQWQIPAWLRQAEEDCTPEKIPVVAFKKNGHPWRVVLPLDYWLTLVKGATSEQGITTSGTQ